MSVFPLLQILFFIAAYFAPKDATQITVAGPDVSVRWTLTANGWSNENKVWSLKGNSTVVRESGRADDVTNVTSFVKPALTHDWAKEKKVTLAPMQTLEKTKDGFVFRLNAGDRAENVYRITYGKKS
ncbi:hypothetical protein ACXR0O_08395 [Verrucomicrobiota bacterium sgz303538]